MTEFNDFAKKQNFLNETKSLQSFLALKDLIEKI